MLRTGVKVACLPGELIGATGRRYCFKELLQERPQLGRVWTATSGQEKFVLKEIPENIFSNFNQRIWPRLREDTNSLLRLPLDAIPNQRIPMQARQNILKASLQAIAHLHDRDIVHLDVKPDNIMVEHHYTDQETVVERVMLADLENAAYLPKGRWIKGMLAGNENRRSPEAHFKGELNKPSDIFSFGLVCIYAMFERIICGPDEDFRKHESQGALAAMIRLQCQVSYFGYEENVYGLMRHVGDEEINREILSMLWEEQNRDYIPYRPFSEWPEIEDEAFRDVMKGIMNLDPAKRLTAHQALGHPWFANIS